MRPIAASIDGYIADSNGDTSAFPVRQETLDDLFVHTLRDIYYAEKQIEKALPKMIDKAGDERLREMAEVWRPDVPLDQNEAYIKRSRELNAAMENALMERFAHGPSAAPIDADDEGADEDPEHGLKMPSRPGGRKVRPVTEDARQD